MLQQSKPGITLVPFGGLANRMRAIASAYALGQQIGSCVNVIWFKDKGLGARFQDIFQDIVDPLIHVKEGSWSDFIIENIPSIRNGWLSKFSIKYDYDTFIDESKMRPDSSFSYEEWARGKNVWWATCHRAIDYAPNILNRLFIPTMIVQEKITQIKQSFSKHTIGVHIRRTDNKNSIKYSPDALFVQRLDDEIDKFPEAKIFLATDSDETKRQFIERYGQRIITSLNSANRSTFQGIVDGLSELYSLSYTDFILGSYYSSFSEIAAEIGGKELFILKRDE